MSNDDSDRQRGAKRGVLRTGRAIDLDKTKDAAADDAADDDTDEQDDDHEA